MMGEGGGKSPASGSAGSNRPPPRAPAEIGPHKGMRGAVLVGLTIVRIDLCVSLAKNPSRREDGPAPPRKPQDERQP